MLITWYAITEVILLSALLCKYPVVFPKRKLNVLRGQETVINNKMYWGLIRLVKGVSS